MFRQRTVNGLVNGQRTHPSAGPLTDPYGQGPGAGRERTVTYGPVDGRRLDEQGAARGGAARQPRNRPTARRIQRRCELPRLRRPLRVRRFRLRRSAECGGRVAAAVCRAGTRRCTWPRPKAILKPSQSSCCAAPTGPSRPTTGNAALRRTAELKPHQPRARRDTPKQVAEQYGKLAEYEAGESQVHPARRRTAPAHCAPHP